MAYHEAANKIDKKNIGFLRLVIPTKRDTRTVKTKRTKPTMDKK